MDSVSQPIPTIERIVLCSDLLSQIPDRRRSYEIQDKLLACLPNAHRILQFQCFDEATGREYKSRTPDCSWVGVVPVGTSPKTPVAHLDQMCELDLKQDIDLSALGSEYDCVILGDLLECLPDPESFLEQLGRITTDDATLLLDLANPSHLYEIERLLNGDAKGEREFLYPGSLRRSFSYRTLCELCMDAGWIPRVADTLVADHPNKRLAKQVLECESSVNIPVELAMGHLFISEYLVQCRKRNTSTESKGTGSLSVVVAQRGGEGQIVSSLRSPGLKEIGAEVIVSRNARSAAEAFENGAKAASNDWIVFCTEDVYFPKGVGYEILRCLSNVPETGYSKVLVGFRGLGVTDANTTEKAGLSVHRRMTWDFPASSKAISIDDCAIVVHRSSELQIDPELGWHLWATDLCLQKLFRTDQPQFADIVRIPILCDGIDEIHLSKAYSASEVKLGSKYPKLAPLCSVASTIQKRIDGSTASVSGSSEPWYGTF
jgi:hypothetical protein